jgi:hypothetical protein
MMDMALKLFDCELLEVPLKPQVTGASIILMSWAAV